MKNSDNTFSRRPSGRQPLDLQFLLKVLLDGFLDLDLHHIVRATAVRLTGVERQAVGEGHIAVAGVDVVHDVAPIGGPLVG